MTEASDSNSPKPRRVLPRAALLSRLARRQDLGNPDAGEPGPVEPGPVESGPVESGRATVVQPTASPGDAPRGLQVLRDFQNQNSTFRESTPVRFRPLVDSWANRSVIVSSFGLLLCFLPVLSLFGLLMGAISMRRIKTSAGSLVGAKTARFGAILGAVGVVMGVAIDVVFVLAR